MFQVGQLGATITADSSGFNREMRQIKRTGERAANDVSRSFKDIGSQLMGVGAGLTAGLTVPIGLAGVAALKSAAQFESLKVQLEVLTGSAEEGQNAFQQLTKYATETPFALKDVVKAGKRLITVLGDVGKANKVLKNLGDISAIANVPLSDMATILAQIQTKGQAMTEELRQFGERGVPIFEILANSMNMTKTEVQALVTAGKVGFQDMARAIAFATSKQGMFYQGAIKASKTLGGIWSNLTGQISVSLSKIGQSIVKTFNLKEVANGLIAVIKNITEWFTGLSGTMQGVIIGATALAAAIGPIAIAVGAVMAVWPALVAGLTAAAPVLLAATAAIAATVAGLFTLATTARFVYENWEMFKQGFLKIWAVVKNAALESIASMIDGLAWLAQAVPGVSGSFAGLAATVRGSKGEVPKITAEWVGWGDIAVKNIEYVKGLWDGLVNSISAGKGLTSPDGINVPIKTVTDEVIPSGLSLESLTSGIDLSIPDKLFPSGSLGALQQKLGVLREKMRFAFTPERVAQLKEQIGLTKEQIAQLTGQTQQSGQALAGFVKTIDNVFQQAVIHGKNLGDILANIGRQLASKALINGLAMLLSGGTFSIGKMLFGSIGSIIGVGDALIRDNGDVVKFHPDDNILAMKDFGNLMPETGSIQPMQGASISGGITKAEMSQVFGSYLQKLGPEEIFAMSKRGQFSY